MGGPGEGLQVFNVNQIVFKAKKVMDAYLCTDL